MLSTLFLFLLLLRSALFLSLFHEPQDAPCMQAGHKWLKSVHRFNDKPKAINMAWHTVRAFDNSNNYNNTCHSYANSMQFDSIRFDSLYGYTRSSGASKHCYSPVALELVCQILVRVQFRVKRVTNSH